MRAEIGVRDVYNIDLDVNMFTGNMMTQISRPLWKDTAIAVATLVVTMTATLGAMRLPLLPGMKYHDGNPLGWIPFFGIPIATVIVTAKRDLNWKRYALTLFLTFVAFFACSYVVFAILAAFR